MQRSRPSAFVFYHYFAPDDVVSAVLFGDLSAELARSGWRVTAFPCVWGCRDESIRFPKHEVWKGVEIKRVWRPRFRQSSVLGRFLNSLWMVMNWSLLSLWCRSRVEVVILGTDPPLSILAALAWRVFHRETRIIHWCHDLFPEAAIADGLFSEKSIPIRILRPILGWAYAVCDSVVDLGPCMRRLLNRYRSGAGHLTIVPWAIDEPAEILPSQGRERARIFGDAALALLYTGTLGRAHGYDGVLDLLALLEPHGARMAFSIRGNRVEELKREVAVRGLDIRFPEFALPADLAERSACADIHVVSLRPEWSGTVVPCKFFGALAAGRPVLFYGSEASSVAEWIRSFGVGWVLHDGNVKAIASQLMEYAKSGSAQRRMRERCFDVYRSTFSRAAQLTKWRECLTDGVICEKIPAESSGIVSSTGAPT